MTVGFRLPSDPLGGDCSRATGFGTPSSDTSFQVFFEPPRRVVPIVFLPGIMGSNLRITDEKRIGALRRKDTDPDRNIAWRPDTFGLLNAAGKSQLTPAERQLMLDPATTAVDVYNPNSSVSTRDGDGRHANVELAPNFDSPLLASDGPGTQNRRTAAQKARMRGWGEVYFDSYGRLLQHVESRMQRVFSNGKPAEGWQDIVGVDPVRWHLDPSTPQKALTEAELKAITKGSFFPVHAIGYNWLIDNRLSAIKVAERVRDIVKAYRESQRRDCPGVIVVTHSMGGLLGRALVHPDMGGLQDLVLGIVHGVQPAAGAPAAYRRMRAGFEDAGLLPDPKASIGAKIAGNFGDEVTAVLANSPGGLQLLPSKAYGNGWLRVQAQGRELISLPVQGDPYEEIYKLRGKWYGLIADESWLNPANVRRKGGVSPVARTHECIDSARIFHDDLGDAYHRHTYVHYGAGPSHLAFGNVTWQLSANCGDLTDLKNWKVIGDDRQGAVRFTADHVANSATLLVVPGVSATIDAPDEPGDLTVPMRSADRQKHFGKCKAVFRQTGYDHQGSYKNEAVLAATLYSILRIAERVQLP